MPQLIGLLDSPYVRRVAISMRLHGIAHEHVVLSVFRQREAMQHINPTLKVPALILDDGTRLLDSSLILDWVEQQVEPDQRLLPAGVERWRALEALGLALVVCEKAVQLYYEFTLRPPELRFDSWLERCSAQLHAALTQLECHAELAFTTADRPRQSQITAAVGLSFIRHIQQSMTQPLVQSGLYPRLEALTGWCETLPAFQQTPL